MITAIQIERMRGIRAGRLEGLTDLTVLVGPSGAGKSTILDALLIGASGSPGDAIGRVVKRRAELLQGARWLFQGQTRDARIQLEGHPFVERKCTLSWTAEASPELVAKLPFGERRRYPTEIACEVRSRLFGGYRSRTVLSTSNAYAFDIRAEDETSEALAPGAFRDAVDVRIIEPAAGANHAPIHRPFSVASERGRYEAILELVQAILDDATGLRVLTTEDRPQDQPVLHVEFKGHTVPVAGAGTGVYAMVRLAIDLAAQDAGIALVEEPEAHQHPAAIRQSAKVLLAAARRGIQVVVSTHSLDLIDSLLAEGNQADLDRLSVVRVLLDGGQLRSSHFTGPMVETARRSIDEDLR